MSGVIASITVFKPDLDRLEKNITAILEQVSDVVLIINGKDFEEETLSLVSKINAPDKLHHITNPGNSGVATALNQAMQYAADKGYDWVVTLDQDSVCPPDLVIQLSRHCSKERVGIIAPSFIDENYYRNVNSYTGWKFVMGAITSASLTNVAIWKEVGGFDDEFFIDYVDYEYWARLITKGYAVIVDYDVHFKHKIGDGKQVKLFNRFSFVVKNHSPFRKFYYVRNIRVFKKRYPKIAGAYFVKREMSAYVIGVIFFEKHNIKNLSAMIRGYFAANKMIKKDRIKAQKELNQVREEIQSGEKQS